MAPIWPASEMRVGHSETLRHRAVLGAALVLCACGAATQSNHVEVNLDSLRQRPLTVQALSPGSTCPVSSEAHLSNPPLKAPAFGYGDGPVYLTGQTEWYSGEAAVLMVDPKYTGEVLVRGRQMDGAQTLPLGPASTQGDVEITSGPSSNSWRVWTGQIAATGPGCFGLQADGADFTNEIIFYVSPGTPPPG